MIDYSQPGVVDKLLNEHQHWVNNQSNRHKRMTNRYREALIKGAPKTVTRSNPWANNSGT